MPVSTSADFVSAYPWDLSKLKSDGAKETGEEYEYMLNNYFKNVGIWRNAHYTEGSPDNYTAKQTYDIYQKYELNQRGELFMLEQIILRKYGMIMTENSEK